MSNSEREIEGYVLFARLIELTANCSSARARLMFDRLGSIIKTLVHEPDIKLSSPYGAILIFREVHDVINCAEQLIAGGNKEGLRLSIAVDWGAFSRVHDFRDWNRTALAINRTARLAALPEVIGKTAITPRVREDLRSIGSALRFDKLTPGELKGMPLQYALGQSNSLCQPPELPSLPEEQTTESRQATVLVVDIRGFSKLPSEGQQNAISQLSKCIATTIDHHGFRDPDYFGPAGDGGCLVYLSGTGMGSSSLWAFAKILREEALRGELPIGIAITSGPLIQLQKPDNTIVGPSILRADAFCSACESGEVAFDSSLWTNIPAAAKTEWVILEAKSDDGMTVVGRIQPTTTQPTTRLTPKYLLLFGAIIAVVATLLLLLSRRGPGPGSIGITCDASQCESAFYRQPCQSGARLTSLSDGSSRSMFGLDACRSEMILQLPPGEYRLRPMHPAISFRPDSVSVRAGRIEHSRFVVVRNEAPTRIRLTGITTPVMAALDGMGDTENLRFLEPTFQQELRLAPGNYLLRITTELEALQKNFPFSIIMDAANEFTFSLETKRERVADVSPGNKRSNSHKQRNKSVDDVTSAETPFEIPRELDCRISAKVRLEEGLVSLEKKDFKTAVNDLALVTRICPKSPEATEAARQLEDLRLVHPEAFK